MAGGICQKSLADIDEETNIQMYAALFRLDRMKSYELLCSRSEIALTHVE